MTEASKLAEVSKKKAELSRRLETAKADLKMKQGFLDKRIKDGGSIGSLDIDVKYAANKVEQLSKELERLK